MNIDIVNPLYVASWFCLNYCRVASIQIVDFILNYLFLSNFQYSVGRRRSVQSARSSKESKNKVKQTVN